MDDRDRMRMPRRRRSVRSPPFKPRQLTGMDFAEEAVRFCTERHRAPGLAFVPGDAESLPFDDASFDAVLNVESSHCYGSVRTFLGQVRRVLRPGGYFLFADLRRAPKRDRLHRDMLESGMEVLEAEDITANVLEALRLDSERKAALIAQRVDKRQRVALNAFREFAAVEGTTKLSGPGRSSTGVTCCGNSPARRRSP